MAERGRNVVYDAGTAVFCQIHAAYHFLGTRIGQRRWETII